MYLQRDLATNLMHILYVYCPRIAETFQSSVASDNHTTPWRSANDDEKHSLLDSSSDLFELHGIKALMCIREEFFSGIPH